MPLHPQIHYYTQDTDSFLEKPTSDSRISDLQSVTVEATPTTFAADTAWPDLSWDGSDPFGFNNISDAWFGQQLTNLDWLEIPQF